MMQGMFEEPIDSIGLPKNAVILRPHWQYTVKRSGRCCSRMCCNESKKEVSQLHAVSSTWSSCVELPVQRLFLGICVDSGSTIYGGEATDTYVHLSPPNDTYLTFDDAYADWYKDMYNVIISKQMVLPVQNTLQGDPESRKMWMKMVDDILINQLEFYLLLTIDVSIGK